MGWVKGTPRKGHVNKDGSAHAARGTMARAAKKPIVIKRISAPMPQAPSIKEPVPHGDVKHRPVIEVCPVCLYAYADGGWCMECGWTQPINARPYGTVTGKRYS